MSYDIKTASLAMLACLPKRSAAILEKRFGLAKSGKRFTLEAIGNSYGITRERVRQIESDGLNRIRKAVVFTDLQPLFSGFTEYIKQQGGIVAENQLFSHFSREDISPEAVRFLFTLHPSVIYRGESDTWHSRWGLDGTVMDLVEHALSRVARAVESKDGTVAYDELSNMMRRELSAESMPTPSNEILSAYVGISKQIDKNYFNQWGHTSSSLVRPRGVRDLAYLVFQQASTPMHFSTAADHIRKVAAPRRVHAQTVHNELIKDKRFVLVGRGMYGLAEWGYEPGTVQDIIARVLSLGSLSKDALVEKVLSKRQVKENTILINLQNRRRFQKLPDGTYGNVI
ncbi:MAG: hypothetical protein A3H64_02850 [Candidatus Ryanbacteria bacterium RIFCSPLOWO2_02_FULL_45_11c]|uniref:HTH HARE-type domain-containing protein n=1 Tax=Candidatus Ryanbacteria bacterium RIFCSPLOWO2_02_FULL_45_11c TaxID=1802128 RepID=A0A1G2GTK4_9BACT|nr:MAG: hypothetical protein A3H64_02850 [Candidatus Ryanbacteria bacterium RIFCSPLOWO2_02_FULL_45_11c]